MFTAPQSSSPATPDRNRRNRIAEPSTTPAGPPPSSNTAASFTPRDPPPSSVFGSSQLRSAQSSTNARNFSARTKNGTPGQAIAIGSAFNVPDSSPLQEVEDEDEDIDEAEDEDEDEDEEDEDENEDEDEDMTDGPLFDSSVGLVGAPRGQKRSSRGEPIGGALTSAGEKPAEEDESAIAGIAKSMAASAKSPTLHEPDDLILKTENIVGRISQHARRERDEYEEILGLIKDLIIVWKSSVRTDSVRGGIGPKETALPLTKANYLSSLLLQIYHPLQQPTQGLSSSRLSRSGPRNSIISKQPDVTPDTPMPKSLLDWLNQYHNPYPNELEFVSKFQPSSTAHDDFWDVLFASVLRGRIIQVIHLLREANFSHAQSALDDGYDEPGYQGDQLASVRTVIANAVILLESCPAVSGDWDVKGKDWALFRHQVNREMINLEAFAEGDSQDKDIEDKDIGTSSRRGKALSLSTASRRAESRVPWTIYENLKTLYGQLRGSVPEITLAAQDWVESSIFLTVWWDGEENEPNSLTTSRRSVNRPQPREVDLHPLEAYKDKLYDAYTSVTEGEDAEFTVDTANPIQVGLACIFEDELVGVIKLISIWSMTIASAVVEIGTLARWLPQGQGESSNMMDEFDQSDLMVLSYADNQQPDKWKATDILIRYADLLSQKPNIWSADKRTQREGWELAVQILSRLENRQTANDKLDNLLNNLSLDSSERVDKVLNLCTRLDLNDSAQSIAQKYAEHLQDTSSNYGLALLYYARAHNGSKIKEVLNLLIAYSLVLSSAYPPRSDLDPRLKYFLSSPRDSLATLGNIDSEAAQLLSVYLSGYATLRKFYDLRDEEVNLKAGKKPNHRPLERKRNAAAALIAVIESASDNVRGGLYDPDADAVVQVDALLTLLGEALPFINQSPRILSQSHLTTLLSAVEDLQTAPSRLHADATDCLRASLTHAWSGPDAPSPRALLLKKSTSNVSSQFSLVGGSQMLGSGEQQQHQRPRHTGDGSTEGSGVLLDSASGLGMVKRGWDWRVGLSEEVVVGREADVVVRMVRVGVAQEVARGWMEGEA